MPVTCAPAWQAKKSARRQLSQEKQCQACQPTPTRWPGCHRPGTSLPTASITPTTSCPGTRGKVMPGHWPSLVKTSLWQTPQAWTLIRTDPGPGSGIGRSTSSRGPPGRETWATRIVALRVCISVSCGVTVGVTVRPGLLFARLGNGHLHLIARLLSVPADIPGGDAVAVAPPSGLNYALSVLSKPCTGADQSSQAEGRRRPRSA